MRSRLGRASEGSGGVPLPEECDILAPPVEFLPPYHAVQRGSAWSSETEGSRKERNAGLTIDEAIAHLNADAEE